MSSGFVNVSGASASCDLLPPQDKPQFSTKQTFLLDEEVRPEENALEELSFWRRKYEKLKGSHMQKERELDNAVHQVAEYKSEMNNNAVRVREVEKAHEKMRELEKDKS